ncbi:MAG: hypothetical protein ACFBZ9_03600 [Sphingomonadales bacterium]
MQQIAFGILHYSPAVFYDMSLCEFNAATTGLMQASGAEPRLTAPSQAEVDEAFKTEAK